jgi:hypothetical protein
MNYLSNTQVLVLTLAVSFGIYVGIQIVLVVLKYVSNSINGSRTYYGEGNYSHSPNQSGCSIILILLLGAGLLFMAYRTNLVQDFLVARDRKVKDNNGLPELTVPQKTKFGIEDAKSKPSKAGAPPIDDSEHDSPEPEPHILEIHTHEDWGEAEKQMRYFAQQNLQTGYYVDEAADGTTVYKVFLGTYNSLTDAYQAKQSYDFGVAIVRPVEAHINLIYYQG